MKIRREVFAVAAGVRDEKGDKGEPEQMPTRTLVEAAMPTNVGGEQKTMPLLFTHDAPAGEMAQQLAARCSRCKHFRKKAWQQLVAECDYPTAPLMKRQAINEVRAALLQTKNAQIVEPGADYGDEMDVETVLKTHMGLCSALSEVRNDYVVVHFTGCCPDAVKTADRPVGFFVPKDREARKDASAVYDDVLKRAAGKVL